MSYICIIQVPPEHGANSTCLLVKIGVEDLSRGYYRSKACHGKKRLNSVTSRQQGRRRLAYLWYSRMYISNPRKRTNSATVQPKETFGIIEYGREQEPPLKVSGSAVKDIGRIS